MPKQATITLDSSGADVHDGDTVTFTIAGVRQGTVTINTWDNGLVQAERKPAGEPFTLTAAGDCLAYLMDNKEVVAFTSFEVLP